MKMGAWQAHGSTDPASPDGMPRWPCVHDAYENGLTRPLYISRRILARDRR